MVQSGSNLGLSLFKKVFIMRVLLQRVERASVSVEGQVVASIGKGLLLLFGVEDSPKMDQLNWLCQKILKLRVFKDEQGKMNLSILDLQAELLLVSQFTLFAETKKGNRPSYTRSAEPEVAKEVYEMMITKLSAALGKPIQTGVFGANMDVELINQGPVTIMIDSELRDF
jgi:D-aminoacyl-tRNA deacylase